MVRLMSCGFAVFLGMLIVFGSRIAAQGPAAKAAIPAYNLQEIPKQIFADGGILQFRIQDLAGARVSVTSDPQPQGALAVDANGVFTFSPTQYDAGNFYISFQKQNPGSAAPTKQVTISVFGNLAPEYTLVSKGRKQPDEASLQYITKTETEEPVHRAFNYRADQKVMDVVISGKTVVLDSAADSNNLMHQIGNRTDIGSLSIYAQTLMIKSGLVVPAANVHIYARQLLFDDGNAPAGTAFIATTPLTDKFAPEIGANGLPGLAAGSVSVNVEKFVRPPGNMPRFIISGGDGQNAGLGQSKVPGSSMPCYKGISLNGTCVVHIHQFAGPTSFGADNTWPQSGDDATKPGAPGPGGPPGDFVSNVSGWAPFIKADPGKPGAMAQHVDGGPAGQPIHALNVEIREQNGRGGLSPGPCPDDRFQLPKQCKVRVGPAWFQLLSVESESYTHPGKSFDPPTAPAVTYPPSNISVSGISDAWLQPAILRAVLNHAEDAYIDGAVDYTASVLQDFGALVDKKLADWDADSAARKARNEAALSQPLSALPAEIRQQIDFIWDPSQPNAQGTLRAAVQRVIDQQEDDHNSFVQTQLEIASIATRIAHNLDYFDHPAGWVPQLSLAYTLQAYNNEVKNDLPILYLAYYISQSSADKERHLKSLTELQSNLSADVSTLTDKVNNAQVEMLKLENQAQQIDGDISLEEQDVNNRLITLTQQAQKIVDERDSVPFWKSCVKVLSVAASVCPVGQPMVGAVGVGLNALSDAGQQGVGETLQQLGDVAGDFSKENIHKSVEQYHAQLAKLDPSNAKNTVDYVKGLVPMAQGIAKEYQAINSSLQTHKASSDEVNKELAQLEASDAEFTQDSEKMKDLNSRKQLFEDQLGQEMDETAKNMDNIQSDWQAIDSTNRAIENFSAAIDHEAVQQVQLFGRRTRDRLLRYQYYLAKA